MKRWNRRDPAAIMADTEDEKTIVWLARTICDAMDRSLVYIDKTDDLVTTTVDGVVDLMDTARSVAAALKDLKLWPSMN